MSENYLPLFRKYRPQSFGNLVGQESLVKALSNAIELKRIANAYLFCGPRGTGKTSSARIFAKSLNCECGPTLEPCQTCASCVDITNATGVDVIEIDAATNRGVEGAEELIAQVHYAPVRGKYKIFIIDEVHMLSTTAFNALLKTFEEPPENVIFILATTEPHKVLETIVSRCQRFDFRRITVDDIVKRLREISDIEKIKITDDALFAIAKNVSGGLRDSLALLDQVSILGAKEEITKDMIEELLGKVTFDKLFNLLQNILNKDIENSLKLTDEIYSKGSEPRNLCENFIEFLRNISVVLSAKNPQSVVKFTTLTTVDIEKITNSNFDKNECQRILDLAIEYYKEIKFATNPYLWMELLIIQGTKEQTFTQNETQVKIAKAPIVVEQKPKTAEVKPSVQVETKPEIIEPKPEIVEEQPKTKEEPAVQQAVNTSAGSEIEIWSNIVNAIESVPAKFFYSGMGKLVSVNENRITLAFINQNVISQAKSDLKFNALVAAEKKIYGGTYNFDFIQLTPNIQPLEGTIVKPAPVQEKPQYVKPQKTEEKTAPNKQEEETKTANLAGYSPKVKEMLEAFSGKIVE